MRTGLILGLTAAFAIPAAYADSIIVNSSDAVTFLSNGTSTNSDFPSAFTTASFASAQTGANAAVLTHTPFYLTATSLTNAGAQWIGTSAGGGDGSTADYTALYAISFPIPDAFVSGSMTLNYEVDNELGDLNPGVYLNGTALSSSAGIPGTSSASFTTLNTYTDNITADLLQGSNWLYIDAVNLGEEGGLIFSADISTVNATASVLEPSSAILLSTILLAVACVALKRKLGGLRLGSGGNDAAPDSIFSRVRAPGSSG
jgi:hypothetical protein